MIVGVLSAVIVLGIVLVILGRRGTRLPWVPGRRQRQAQLERDVDRGIEDWTPPPPPPNVGL